MLNVVKSITDINYYKKIYKQPFWKSILYMLVLSLFIFYIGAYMQINKLDSIIKNNVTAFVNNLPEFSIQNGELTVIGKQPIEYNFGNFVIIIDTTDQYKQPSCDTSVIFGKTHVSFTNVFRTRDVKYSSILGKLNLKSIDKKYLLSVIPLISLAIKNKLLLLYTIAYFFWLPFYKFWSILFLSLIALYVDYRLNSQLTYKSLLNISVYAITLPWIIKLMYKGIGLNGFGYWFIYFIIYWVVAIAYVYYAVKCISDEQKQNVKPQLEIDKTREFTLD